MNETVDEYFRQLAALQAGQRPHAWQLDLATEPVPVNRLIRIPTGMGKTYGVLGAWLWNRIARQDERWPRRLVWCLPMRVLVEQVVEEVGRALQRLGGPAAAVAVHPLMGGADAGEWSMYPERAAVLVGTQDMLLSRALNRGYGASRARWPMEFGLLNQDCLWVMDEVQLMDVGLTTATQLQAFRDDEAARSVRPCCTWWMSATLQAKWLTISPDTVELIKALPETVQVPAAARVGPLWEDVAKPVRSVDQAAPRQVAELVIQQHQAAGQGRDGPTLVVLNQVRRAVEVHDEIRKLLAKTQPAGNTRLHLVHSRFRPAERAGWRGAFLNRSASGPANDRIVVATQVIEAGVDMSSAVLVTDLAPWPSLVQRFGRAARWGGQAQVFVVDGAPKDDKAAAPYTKAEMDAAAVALKTLTDVAPRSLEAFEETHPEMLPSLYPYEPRHVLLRRDLDDLFDTAADLSGTDIDISRFIRSGDERDVQVFWRKLAKDEAPPDDLRAVREELCTVPFLSAREWLCDKDRRKTDVRAWVWDWLNGAWRLLDGRDIYPGQTLLVAAEVGGYDPVRGWDPKARPEQLVPVALPADESIAAADLADSTESDESLSVTAQWQSIAFHGREVGRLAHALANKVAPQLAPLFELAGRWHDAGKAHPAFQASLREHAHGTEVAKAPATHWYRGDKLYRAPDGERRGGFRHELASTLALFALLRRCDPDHAALLGPWRDLLVAAGQGADLPEPAQKCEPAALTPIEREVIDLDADSVDLLLYLVCTHHGKVRMSWQASPADQAARDRLLRIRGVREGDDLPAFHLSDAQGKRVLVPAETLVLAAAGVGLNAYCGRGWTERVLGLLQRHGPFTLGWMEAVFRAADQRASADAGLVDPDMASVPAQAVQKQRSDAPAATLGSTT